jgi:copper(I)-binding protein
MIFARVTVCLSLLAVALPAAAQEIRLGQLVVERSFARVSAARNGAAYVTILNNGAQPDRLLRADSPRAGKTELHTMTMEGDIMCMRQVPDVEVPAKGRVEMRPGEGLHIMLIGLKAPLRAGDRFPLSLEFARSGKIDVTVEVLAAAPASKP